MICTRRLFSAVYQRDVLSGTVLAKECSSDLWILIRHGPLTRNFYITCSMFNPFKWFYGECLRLLSKAEFKLKMTVKLPL
jgi:hypothetical protein